VLLRLPYFDHSRSAVLNGLSSADLTASGCSEIRRPYTAAQFLDDAVMRDYFADHVRATSGSNGRHARKAKFNEGE
jgi:hypothetical protein